MSVLLYTIGYTILISILSVKLWFTDYCLAVRPARKPKVLSFSFFMCNTCVYYAGEQCNTSSTLFTIPLSRLANHIAVMWPRQHIFFPGYPCWYIMLSLLGDQHILWCTKFKFQTTQLCKTSPLSADNADSVLFN